MEKAENVFNGHQDERNSIAFPKRVLTASRAETSAMKVRRFYNLTKLSHSCIR